MEDDIFSALIGEGPNTAQRQAALAAALRKQKTLGQLGQITGDRVLSPLGQGMGKEADQYAEQLQQQRQAGIEATQRDRQLGQTELYQKGQLDHMKATEELTRRGQTLDHVYQMLMAQAALNRADKVSTPKIPKLRQGDIKDLQDMSQTLGGIKGLEDFLAGGGTFGAVEMAGVPIPGARALKNTLAAKGLGTEKDKESYLAKQTWDRLYTLAERNRLFGATLTTNEQKSWRDANPSSNLTDKQIRQALPIMQKVLKHRLDSKVSGLTKEGYNPEAMADYADIPGVNLPVNASAAAVPGAPKRIRVDAEGNVVGN